MLKKKKSLQQIEFKLDMVENDWSSMQILDSASYLFPVVEEVLK